MNYGTFLPVISSSLIFNLLIGFIIVRTIKTEFINKTSDENVSKNISFKILYSNESKENLTDQIEINGNITQEFHQNSSLVANKSSNETVEANSTALNTSDVNTNETELLSDKTNKKSINRRSFDTKIFGYFSEFGDFHYCTEPPLNTDKRKGITEQKAKVLNSTFWKCQYFDGEELNAKFSRKIQSNNGFKGVFGYYQFRKFHNCTAPERLIQNSTRPDIRYIPFDLNYDSMCDYFDNDPGDKYDWAPNPEKFVSDGSDHLDVTIFNSSIQFFSFVLVFLTKSYLI